MKRALVLSAVVSILFQLVSTQGLAVLDTAAAGGCSGGGSCCMPSCTVNFPAIPGNDKCKGGGSVAWIGNCRSNGVGTKQSSQHKKECGGIKMIWDPARDVKGWGKITVEGPNNYKRTWQVGNCKLASVGGGQCVPSHGGCDIK